MGRLLILLAAALAMPVLGQTAGSPEPVWSADWERFLAHRWVAGDGAPAMDDGRRFLVVCDPALGSYLRSLRELAELRAEYRRDPAAWSQGRHARYTCISRDSLRLVGPSNLPLSRRADPDQEGINEGYYRVVREDADSQLIELHYRDRNTDIYDSFYRYEIRGDRVIPLESWVWGRGNFQLAMATILAIVVLLSFAVALYMLVRFLARRRAGAGQRQG